MAAGTDAVTATGETAVVVGGGVAGLVAARRLAQAGADVTIVDAGELGGSVARERVDGLDLDVGAEGFATRGGAVAALLAELGLADRRVTPSGTGTFVVAAGHPARIPDGAALGIPTDLDDGDALAVLGEDAAARVQQDRRLPAAVGADALTLGGLVRARMGDAVVDTWVRPLVAAVHRLDVDDIAPGLLLPGVLARLAERGSLAAALAGGGGQLAGLAGGMAQLVEALVGDLTSRGVRSVPVGAAAVEPDLQGWRVRTSDDAVLHADRLLLACPPWFWPTGLPEPLAAAGRDWPAPRTVDLVTLVLADDGGGRRSGVVVAESSGAGDGFVRARALTYSSAKWPWLQEQAGERAVVRLTYDADDRRLADDDALIAQAVADAAALTGATWREADLRGAHRRRWLMPRSAVDPGMSEHRERVRDARAATPDLDATGGWLAGTGIAWVVADAPAAADRLLGRASGT